MSMKSFVKLFAALLAVFIGGVNFANAYVLKSYEGRFSIEFPSQPKLENIRDVGTCMKERHEFRSSEGQKIFFASYQDCLPHGYLADVGHGPFLRDYWQNVEKAVRGELRANNPIEHGVLSGREYLIAVPHGNRVVRLQLFIDGDRLYKIMYVGPFLTQDEPEVESFFASFRVTR